MLPQVLRDFLTPGSCRFTQVRKLRTIFHGPPELFIKIFNLYREYNNHAMQTAFVFPIPSKSENA